MLEPDWADDDIQDHIALRQMFENNLNSYNGGSQTWGTYVIRRA